MSNRTFVALAVVITAFAALVIASSMGGDEATHVMPNGETMQSDDMDR